jgi:membrane protein required for colicin V production
MTTALPNYRNNTLFPPPKASYKAPFNGPDADMPFQLLDLILGGIMIISGLLALMRGFTREVLSLVAWGAAAVAALFAVLNPQLVEMAGQYLEPPIVAKIALGGGVFLVVLIIVSLISIKISDYVVDSAAGAFDRTLGLVYGLARGLVLVVIAYIFYGWLTPLEAQVPWIKNARSIPIINQVKDVILSFVPADIADMLKNTNIITNPDGGPTTTETKPAEAPAAEAPAGDGADAEKKVDTEGLDQLIEGTEGKSEQKPEFGGEGNAN